MRSALLFLSVVLFGQHLLGQQSGSTHDSVFLKYFSEVEAATKKFTDLWNLDLYGPILLVDPQTREIIAANDDSLHVLQPSGEVFRGRLPLEVNIANTSVSWNGVRWAMIMLPLPDSLTERNNLLAHELFHRIQPELGFTASNPANAHLNNQNGRIYLRLELEALKKALRQGPGKKQKDHLTDAMVFRCFRNSLYQGSATEENLLELNEGLAEYTALVISGRTGIALQRHLISEIDKFYSNPTFVRSFAYHTLPAYGIILQTKNPGWNKDLSNETDFSEYLRKALKITLPADLKTAAEKASADYNGEVISKEEHHREIKRQKLVGEYIKRYTVDPHVELVFEKMSVSFDPRNIFPVDTKGAYYSTIRISDEWGILDVSNGALMSQDWDKIYLSVPVKIQGQKVSGPGWVLDLNDTHKLFLEDSGDYSVRKK
jgi:hypothetical protein